MQSQGMQQMNGMAPMSNGMMNGHGGGHGAVACARSLLRSHVRQGQAVVYEM